MKKSISFWIFCIAGAVLALLSLVYAIIFGAAYSNFTAGGEVFRAALHLNLLITLIVFNSLYLIALAVFLLIRKLRFKTKR